MSDHDEAGQPGDPAEWSDDQWAEWFRDEVEPTDQWRTHTALARANESGQDVTTRYAELEAAGQADEVTQHVAMLVATPEGGTTLSLQMIGLVPTQTWHDAFSRLSQDLKLAFHRSWTQIRGIQDAPYPEDASGWGWQKWAAPVAVAGVIIAWVVISDGDEPAADDATTQVAADEDEGTSTDSAPAADLGATSEVTDPTGDFLAEDDLASRGFENVEQDPPAGLDITDVQVTYAPGGADTIVTISFAGDARSLESDEARSTTISVLFDTADSLLFSVEYGQASSFVSGAEDVSVTHEWLSNDQLRITLSGHAPAAGDAVRINTFSRTSGDSDTSVQGDTAQVDIDG